jgi:predicted ATP-binding protein involved in virulence
MYIENTTTIKSIKIEKLFEIFDYNVEYPNGENVLLITGPNGYGKTQVLNILFNLFNRKFTFFKKLIFEKIIVTLNNKSSIQIKKHINTDKSEEVEFIFYKNEKNISSFKYSDKMEKELLSSIERHLPLHRIDDNRWVIHHTDEVIETDEVISRYSDNLPDNIEQNPLQIESDDVTSILDSINVHLIKEQRLFKKISSLERNYRGERNQTVMIETIQTYSNELRDLINERTQKSYEISQSLDSSYPNRLISEKKKVTKEEYDLKFENLTKKQNQLMLNGLYEKTQVALEYSRDDAKALLVYLNDLEQKLEVFDDLLEKLELFTSILNNRRFTFKSINIDKNKGFYFTTSKGSELQLNQLSSGEQHEVVLLYELIFKTSPSILVLIDEPEISLHITWQKEFLDDLLRIIKIQNFQVLIATHSPSIINDRWDLVYNLEKNDS